MLTTSQKQEVKKAVVLGLDNAEKTWKKIGSELLKEGYAFDHAIEAHLEPSRIPGHPLVSDNNPVVEEFVAVMVDMRDSSKHLKTRVNGIAMEGIQRIYFETSALLPAVAVTTGFREGVVTEYLGDGALVLFPVQVGDRPKSVRAAYQAARDCVDDARAIINEELYRRYKLPSIDLGAGLSLSKALVTLVGTPGNLQPKAIGECVWEASKLSGGRNAVFVAEGVKKAWPATQGERYASFARLLRD
ncbi:hypothetical protein KAF44_22465 (plasmid) [Cupriavidus necator]|nr:hypothetical protein KAF44_22465 [Cupriavidus necator]